MKKGKRKERKASVGETEEEEGGGGERAHEPEKSIFCQTTKGYRKESGDSQL